MTDEKTEPAPRITNTQKEKDPRKVEAGKKLGAVSKIAKNQKKYKAEAHAASRDLDNDSIADASRNLDYSDYITPFYAVFAVVVVGCLGALYWNSQKQQPKQDLSKPQDAPAPKFRTPLASLAHREAHSNLISLDD